MSVNSARRWLILFSLVACAISFVFLLLAPALGYPLDFPQALRVLELITPVFFGYLGAATHFVFTQKSPGNMRVRRDGGLFVLIVKGPVIVFSLAMAVIFLAFWIGNRPSATSGTGMSVDVLSASITAALALLAASTNVVVSYLFAQDTSKGG